MKNRFLLPLLSGSTLLLVLLTAFLIKNDPPVSAGWEVYGGNKEATRYSPLTQINKTNVSSLKVAWMYSPGEPDTANRSQIQCNPIVVNGILYGATPRKNFFALNATTGKQLWFFNPTQYIIDDTPWWGGTVRGVTYWQDEKAQNKRLLVNVGPFLFCLDALTGKIIPAFGQNGKIDLHNDLDKEVKNAFLTANTPGIIYKNLIILGMRVSENTDAAPGHIRAYNVLTGKREWIFHTIPHPGEYGYDTWEDPDSYKKTGGANCWAGMSLDEKRGIVYVPTGSAAYDFYGGDRKGQNLYANCIIALNAATGKRIWHYQTIHHDLWDKDLPANPNLVTITKDGKKVDCIAQITKSGMVFLLNRETGQPLYPIPEVPVPASELEGEQAWKTQPVPTFPQPFTRQAFTEQDVNDLVSAEENQALVKRVRELRSGGVFMPPTLQGTLLFPGFDGGGEWGGAAFDPVSEMLYVNANEMPWILTSVKVNNEMAQHESMFAAGQRLYGLTCSSCHGADRKGDSQGIFPSLVNIKSKYNEKQLAEIVEKGRRMMPAFKQVPEADRQAIYTYLLELDSKMAQKEYTPATEKRTVLPYSTSGYHRFLTKEGYPAIKPPWGTLNAINLKTGEIAWKVPLGEFEALKKKGVPATGTENYGGPAITAGGLVFIGASQDEKFRVFDKDTGKLLYETQLPAGGYATPAVYEAAGKQFVVIACGGGKMGTKSGDSYVAFALPGK